MMSLSDEMSSVPDDFTSFTAGRTDRISVKGAVGREADSRKSIRDFFAQRCSRKIVSLPGKSSFFACLARRHFGREDEC
jgi:hypothetical protein